MATDKRIIKTRTAIKNAFMAIVLEQDISKVTVSDIAQRAAINRSTFYLHYLDVAAVMDDIVNEIAATISSSFDKFDLNDVFNSTYGLFTNLTSTLNGREPMKKFILYSTCSQYVIEKLKGMFADKFLAALTRSPQNNTADKCHYGIVFLTSGIIDSYIKWSYSADKKISLEELCRQVGELADTVIKQLNN